MNKTKCKLSEEHLHFLRQTRLKLKFQLEQRIEQTLGKAIPLQIKGQKVTLRIFARNIIKNKRMKKLLRSFTVKLHLNFLCLSTVFALNSITRTIYLQGSPFTFYTTITQSCKTCFLHFLEIKLVS